MDLSVTKIDLNGHNKFETIYDGITDPEDAVLLSQLAMCDKDDNELIAIFPGWNRDIKSRHQDEYEKALVLAEKYKPIEYNHKEKKNVN